MIGSILIRPYTFTQSQETNIIVILCSINIFFSLYYIWSILKLKEIFKLETKNIIKFVKIIGIVTLIYIPHVFAFANLFFRNLHNLEVLMISLITFVEILLIGIVLKEVYDLAFIEQSRRDMKIEEDRKKYIETKKNLFREHNYKF